MRPVLRGQQERTPEHRAYVSIEFPEGGLGGAPPSNEDEIHSRSDVWIMRAHRLTQAPPDAVSGYSIANTLRRNETTSAEREMVWFDD